MRADEPRSITGEYGIDIILVLRIDITLDLGIAFEGDLRFPTGC